GNARLGGADRRLPAAGIVLDRRGRPPRRAAMAEGAGPPLEHYRLRLNHGAADRGTRWERKTPASRPGWSKEINGVLRASANGAAFRAFIRTSRPSRRNSTSLVARSSIPRNRRAEIRHRLSCVHPYLATVVHKFDIA